jgi:3-oxoacyl-[acyl-carrier protein] reductase
MDLGLAGRRAIVCASSRGLGKACAAALAREGCEVVLNGRDAVRLAAAADDIERLCGRRPHAAIADLNTPVGRAVLLAHCAEPDILVTNNAGPAPGKLGDWDHATWLSALEANLLAPIELISAVVAGMRQRKFGRIVNITSAVVKSVDDGAHRTDSLLQRPATRGGGRQRDHQQPAAAAHRHRPPAGDG